MPQQELAGALAAQRERKVALLGALGVLHVAVALVHVLLLALSRAAPRTFLPELGVLVLCAAATRTAAAACCARGRSGEAHEARALIVPLPLPVQLVELHTPRTCGHHRLPVAVTLSLALLAVALGLSPVPVAVTVPVSALALGSARRRPLLGGALGCCAGPEAQAHDAIVVTIVAAAAAAAARPRVVALGGPAVLARAARSPYTPAGLLCARHTRRPHAR